MIDHLLIYTTAELHTKTIDFYCTALGPIGYKKQTEYMDGNVVGLGDGTKHPDFWIVNAAFRTDTTITPGYAHFAFSTAEQKLVDDCYAAGLKAGGKDNGAPGPRPMYGPSYYGAFLFDPAGNSMEVATGRG